MARTSFRTAARSRVMFTVITAVTLTGTAAGCSSGSVEGDGAGGGAGETPRVTMSHAFGETTVPENPERIVTLGYMADDISAALGVAPVGTTGSWAGEDGYTPWFRAQVENNLNATLPEIISSGDGISIEQIATLEPDLILAPHSGVTE